ncbi:MAG: ABC transporter ATP-binding protein [bacterium]|nr:ABC transporter ATP-binding protein [bacterium]
MSVITVQHVSKTFIQTTPGGEKLVQAVHDVSLKVPDGEVLAVLGPSGCGKSTLLRLIGGLILPDAGAILYDNVPLETIPNMERGIGMVFQDGALMPHWEARRSVGFFLWLRKREAEVPGRVRRIAQITGIGLEALMDRMPKQLSGGERQRVAVARALARDPRLFLFDEPFSNIDAKLRGTARVELRRLLNEFPVTSVYVTHDQHEAIALADRIAVMDAGRIVQAGTFDQLYHAPLNQFVAQFIGTPPINILKGAVRGHSWHGRTFGGFEVRHDLADGAAVNIGFRPDAVQVVADESGENAIVREITPFYAERYTLLEVEGSGETWQVSVPLDHGVRVSDIVRCTLKPDALFFFDAATGQRIG